MLSQMLQEHSPGSVLVWHDHLQISLDFTFLYLLFGRSDCTFPSMFQDLVSHCIPHRARAKLLM